MVCFITKKCNKKTLSFFLLIVYLWNLASSLNRINQETMKTTSGPSGLDTLDAEGNSSIILTDMLEVLGAIKGAFFFNPSTPGALENHVELSADNVSSKATIRRIF